MTDNEIIKALECCKKPVGSGACNYCPFDYQREKRLTPSDKSCTTLMFDSALDLINRLQAENERLQGGLKTALDMVQEAKVLLASDIKTAKSEARKEFAARLKVRLDMSVYSYSTEEVLSDIENIIDNLLEEMESESNAVGN